MTKKQFFKLGTVAELAKLASRSLSTIYRWRREGIPKSVDINQYTRKKKKTPDIPLTSREKKQRKKQKQLATEFAEYVREKERVAKFEKEKKKVYSKPRKNVKKRIEEIKKAEVIEEYRSERREKRRQIRASRRQEELEWGKEAPLRKITPGRNKANIRALKKQKQKLKNATKQQRALIEFRIEILENWIEQSQKEGAFRYYYFDDRDVVDYADFEDLTIHEAYQELYGY